jgi:hypothetical protein
MPMIGAKSGPKVTLIASIYNREHVIDRTVESIRSQTYRNISVVLVDDGSTDGTFAQLASYDGGNIRVVRQPNRGLTRTLKEQCEVADGEFIAIQGAGDESDPYRIERQVEYMASHRDAAAVGCWVENVDAVTNIVSLLKPQGEVPQGRGAGYAITHGEMLMRTSSYRASGGYRTLFRVGQLTDLLQRLNRIGKIGYVEQVLYRRYLLSDGVSSSSRKLVERRVLVAMSKLAYEIAEKGSGGATGPNFDCIDEWGAVAPYILPRSKAMGRRLLLAAIESYLLSDVATARRLRARSFCEGVSLRAIPGHIVLAAAMDLRIPWARTLLSRQLEGKSNAISAHNRHLAAFEGDSQACGE